MKYSEKDLNMLRECYKVARSSHDNSTRNGVIIETKDKTYPIIESANRIPHGVKVTHGRLKAPKKYMFTEHAERKAIYTASLLGVSLLDSTMYACWASCADCARALVISGVKKLVRHKIPQHSIHGSWEESIKVGNIMLKEAGIEVVDVVHILGEKMKFMGEEIDV